MDDLTRIFGEGKCSCNDCVPDPDPATDHDLPGGLRFGSPEWFKLMAGIGPADRDEFLSEYDLLAGDRPFAEEIDWWAEATREHPAACEIMLAEAQVRRDYEQQNGYFDILDEPGAEAWYRENIREF